MIRRWEIAALAAAGAAVPAAPARAQDPEDALHRRVLDRVEAFLREDDARLRREIRRILDDALGPDASAPSGPRAFLGVGVAALAESERVSLDLADDEGVRILSVRPGSPAGEAGLCPDDILVRVGRRRVGTPEEVRDAVRAHRPGASVSLDLLRGGQPLKVKARLAPADPAGVAAPDPSAAPDPRKALRDDLRLFLDAEESSGAPEAGDPGAPFDAGAFLDGLFSQAPGADHPLRDMLSSLRADPAGEMILAFLREELLTNTPLLRQHVERGPDGRWRLRGDSVDYLRTWLEEEIERDRKRVLREKERKASAPPPVKVRVGFSVRDLDPGERAAAGLPSGVGFVVTRLVPDGPAMRAGLRPGDVVSKIRGRDATEPLLQEALAEARPGDALPLAVLRRGAGAPVALTVTLAGAKPE